MKSYRFRLHFFWILSTLCCVKMQDAGCRWIINVDGEIAAFKISRYGLVDSAPILRQIGDGDVLENRLSWLLGKNVFQICSPSPYIIGTCKYCHYILYIFDLSPNTFKLISFLWTVWCKTEVVFACFVCLLFRNKSDNKITAIWQIS